MAVQYPDVLPNVLIVYNPRSDEARGLAEALASRLGTAHPIRSADETGEPASMAGLQAVVTVGGDGTILRAVSLAAPAGVPLLGVNMGHLGFMTEVAALDALERVPRYLEPGYAWVEERSMLEARVEPATDAGGSWGPVHALNDVVAGRGVPARLVHIRAVVDGVELATYRADAVIVATATGSTGYSLSAGGPILYPTSSDMLLTPVAPHASLSAGVVVPGSAVVELTLLTDHQAALTADGHHDLPLHQGDAVRVSTSPLVARFLRTGDRAAFYERIAGRLRQDRDPARLAPRQEMERRA